MLKSAYKSDVGRVRSVNEDRVVVQEMEGGCLIAIVADGMGGHQAGDTASQMTVELVQASLQRLDPGLPDEEQAAKLSEAIREANTKVYEVASGRDHYRGMGTTLTVALADKERLLIGHIGDSRAYLFHQDECSQLTEDHTLVNELVKKGQLTSEEALTHPRRNVLTRALGTDAAVDVDITRLSWQTGDLLLLCSDGLSNMVPLEKMMRTVRGNDPLEKKAEKLVAFALEAGGDDNITVALISNEYNDGCEGGGSG